MSMLGQSTLVTSQWISLEKKISQSKLVRCTWLIETAKTMHKIYNGISPIQYSQKMVKLEKVHNYITPDKIETIIFLLKE